MSGGAWRTETAHPWARALLDIAQVFALHDIVILGYHAVMYTLVVASGPGESERRCAQRLFLAGSVLALACILKRRGTGSSGWFRSALYRVVVVTTIVGSYLMLRDVLPLLQTRALDAELLELDIVLFGVEPTIWLEPYATPNVVEYFAFFYFSYFALLGAYALIVLGCGVSRDAIAEFSIGCVLIFCIGQLGYVAVPGYGPVHHLDGVFAGPLEGGFFWRCVLATVAAGSAMQDIFPSLHTAAPVWLAAFTLRRAAISGGWRWTAGAVVITFFALNITISTVVLRWHYVVDVFAGLALAAGASFAAPRLARWEAAFRSRNGLLPVW